ncbi:MotA/TolQ/ExbB proton channel family protein [Curtobacterium sp. MCBD17_040]|uniref:motility protein A n=1 Tax=Curtobacterium sp. MCBD17_040 TaxID=2175674 RepID=UPI000DA77B11|nr:MotA/TolQ/ExbB proton channel family protein [Curtobacterium sp. MCBD17_040]WIB65585.1 MotA/TolQ/ExbB proton channel family protein [Curtobacterium sp. MCBD17_040]
MDLAFLLGILLAFGSVGASVVLDRATFGGLLLPAPIILVFGATVFVGLAGGTVSDAISAFSAIPKALKGKKPDFQGTVDKLVELADIVRHSSLIKLEEQAETIPDPFFKTALLGAADGTDSEELRGQLEEEIHTQSRGAKAAAKFFQTLGGYAPTIGIVGTVVSLTHVLENLSSPSKLGPMIASAFVATLWGLLSANFIWLPIAARMRRLNELEHERMNLIVEGVLHIQAGLSARALGERLRPLVPAGKAKKGKGKSGADE